MNYTLKFQWLPGQYPELLFCHTNPSPFVLLSYLLCGAEDIKSGRGHYNNHILSVHLCHCYCRNHFWVPHCCQVAISECLKWQTIKGLFHVKEPEFHSQEIGCWWIGESFQGMCVHGGKGRQKRREVTVFVTQQLSSALSGISVGEFDKARLESRQSWWDTKRWPCMGDRKELTHLRNEDWKNLQTLIDAEIQEEAICKEEPMILVANSLRYSRL